MQTWNVNVERQIGPALGVMVGYFGSHGDRLRIPRNINQFVNGVRPYPDAVGDEPDPARRALGNITETDSLGWSDYKGLWLTANQRLIEGPAVQRVVHAVEVHRHQLAQHRRVNVVQDSNNLADSEGPSDFDVRHRFVDQRDLRAAVQGQPAQGRLAGRRRHAGADRQPGQHRHQHQHVHRREQHAAAGSRRRSGDHRLGDAVVRQQRLRSAHRHRGRVVHVELGVRAAGLGERRVPLRQPGPERGRTGPGFSNTDFSVIKNLDLSGSRAAAAPRRGVQPVQPGEPRSARPHRHGRQHVVRRDHEHAFPDRRLGIGAAGSVRDQGALLERHSVQIASGRAIAE